MTGGGGVGLRCRPGRWSRFAAESSGTVWLTTATEVCAASVSAALVVTWLVWENTGDDAIQAGSIPYAHAVVPLPPAGLTTHVHCKYNDEPRRRCMP